MSTARPQVPHVPGWGTGAPPGAAITARVPAAAESGRGAFTLFLMLTAVLIIRPREFVAAVQDVPMYEALILACCLAARNELARQLTLRTAAKQPITACSYGVFLAIVGSLLARFYFQEAWTAGTEFAKLILYYSLLVTVVNSPRRLRQFMTALAIFVAITTVPAILQYYGYIDVEALSPWLERSELGDGGDGTSIYVRLRSVGLFNDPNDYSLVLVMAMLISIRGVIETRAFRKVLWFALLALLAFALSLTQSRGGFLAFMVACLLLFRARFGWRRAVLIAVVVVPLLLVIFGGRQTEISSDTSTGQGRMQLWWEGFDLFIHTPLFGVGAGQMVDHLGYVAHNSFVHAFTELGFFGGSLFLGCFYAALGGLRRLGTADHLTGDAGVERLRSYLLAVVVGYAVGLMSLSRAYAVPTYIPLGLVTAYLRDRQSDAGVGGWRFNGPFVAKLVKAGVLFVIIWVVVTRLFVHWG